MKVIQESVLFHLLSGCWLIQGNWQLLLTLLLLLLLLLDPPFHLCFESFERLFRYWLFQVLGQRAFFFLNVHLMVNSSVCVDLARLNLMVEWVWVRLLGKILIHCVMGVVHLIYIISKTRFWFRQWQLFRSQSLKRLNVKLDAIYQLPKLDDGVKHEQ